jgi:undecaprenyl-diphosphatase
MDYQITRFFNEVAGKSRLFDGIVGLMSDKSLLTGVIFMSAIWLIWFRDNRDAQRIRLVMGVVAVVLSGVVTRLMQLGFPFRERPIRDAGLHFILPIGVTTDTLRGHSSFPSDTAAWLFALATVLWFNDHRIGILSFLLAAVEGLSRVYLGFHWPSDIATGAVLGAFIVALSQFVPIPKSAMYVLRWEHKATASFYACAFLASYLVATVCDELRTIASVIVRH